MVLVLGHYSPTGLVVASIIITTTSQIKGETKRTEKNITAVYYSTSNIMRDDENADPSLMKFKRKQPFDIKIEGTDFCDFSRLRKSGKIVLEPALEKNPIPMDVSS